MAGAELVTGHQQPARYGGTGYASSGTGPLPMVAGPSPPAPSVLAKLALPAPPINDPGFLTEFAECLRLLRQITCAGQSLPVVVPGTGTAGMEAMVTSLLRPGQPVLVVSTGMWGNRWRDICLRHGVPAQALTIGLNGTLDVALLDQVLSRRTYQAVLATHVDSSSGIRIPIDLVAHVARRRGALSIVDGIAAAGAEHVSQFDWGIDAYLAASPKALAAPAGLAVAVLGDRALALLDDRDWTPAGYSLDLRPWVPVMRAADQHEFGYFQSPAGNLVVAFAEALRLVVEEGVAERIARHQYLRDRLRTGLVDLGLRVAVQNVEAQSNGVTVCWVPHGWDRDEFVAAVARAGVLVQAGTHHIGASRTFRIGHLGNVTEEHIDRTVAAIAAVTHEPGRKRSA